MRRYMLPALLLLTRTSMKSTTEAFTLSFTTRRASSRGMPQPILTFGCNHRTSGVRRRRLLERNQQLSMYLDDVGVATTTFAALASSSSPLLINSAPSALSMITDPILEAELFSDMAHLTLDMAAFFGPATAALRLFAVIGRIFVMTADYVPDHSILREELAFQLLMLFVASNGLIKSTIPIAAAAFATTSARDVRTYLLLFQETGLTWVQYKTMVALAFDWIEVESGFIVTSDEGETEDENIYWLYRGEAHVQSQGRLLQTVVRGNKDPRRSDNHSMALMGEMSFARRLDNRKGTTSSGKNKKKNGTPKGDSLPSTSFPKTTTKAGGPTGATLLRINTSKLTMLMDNDEQLAQSIRCLFMTEMQEKVSALLGK